MPALHEAIWVVGEVAHKDPTHVCDSWRWLALEGEFCVVCDLQETLTTNGMLLTVTADVKTPKGVPNITLPGGHCPILAASVFIAQTTDATSQELLLRWNPFFRRIYGNSFRTRLRQFLGLTEADQVPEFRGTQFS